MFSFSHLPFRRKFWIRFTTQGFTLCKFPGYLVTVTECPRWRNLCAVPAFTSSVTATLHSAAKLEIGLTYTLWADFIPILAVANWQLNSGDAGGNVLQVGKAPHQCCQLSWKPLLFRESIWVVPKRQQQLAEVHNLLPYSQPRAGCACEALNHQQRK